MPLLLTRPFRRRPLPPAFRTARSFVENCHHENDVTSLYVIYVGSVIKPEGSSEFHEWVYIQAPCRLGPNQQGQPDLGVMVAINGENCPLGSRFAALLHESKADIKRRKDRNGQWQWKRQIDTRSLRNDAVKQTVNRLKDDEHWKVLEAIDWHDLVGSVGIGEYFMPCVRKSDDGLIYRLFRNPEEPEFGDSLLTALPGGGYEVKKNKFTSVDHEFFQDLYTAVGNHILRQIGARHENIPA